MIKYKNNHKEPHATRRKKYPHIFSPIKIGKQWAKNRTQTPIMNE